MMLIVHFLLLFWLRHVTAACSGTTTIHAATQASALSSCATWTGDIALATDIAGDVTLDGVEVIMGNLNASSAPELTSISGEDLRSMDALVLTDLSSMTDMSFPRLTRVEALAWFGLHALPRLNFSTPITSVSVISIANTSITTAEGLGLENLESAGTITITTNGNLHYFSLPRLREISVGIEFVANADNFTISLPVISTAEMVWIENSASSLSVPALETVNDTFHMSHSDIETFYAPKLREIGTLKIWNNPDLDNISLPSLDSIIDGMNFTENSSLKQLELDALATVGNDSAITGYFTDISFPALQKLDGHLNVTTTADFDCAPLTHLASNGTISGGLDCVNSSRAISITPTSSSSASPPAGATQNDNGSALSTGAKIGIGVGVAGGAIGVMCVATLLFMLRRHQRRHGPDGEARAAAAAAKKEKKEQKKKAKKGAGGADSRQELQPEDVQELQPDGVQELEPGKVVSEVEGKDREISEMEAPRKVLEVPGEELVPVELPAEERWAELEGSGVASPGVEKGAGEKM
ncbi:uncharacterized protein K452DRAFT_22933 [Aplosporella prunicola CBS 121167]|uniref:Receptor L-domain domain-containing protein n=1 Tax=Aplosporella prunicola CBS 121167 TaxID=1176127 RepID=A0A6A6AW51_9PEZI|nr:uncharacterized protein K452DRAFT_22933 [Aplosporella prunicola CBS 121167]KAF2135413.1 hypothetical protein K452DRAFT_22933 [Aplosporella prunicola CBS 121167]